MDESRCSNMSRNVTPHLPALFVLEWHGLKAASPKMVTEWKIQASNLPFVVEPVSALQ